MHLVWAGVALFMLWGGFDLGFRMYAFTLGNMYDSNVRFQGMSQIGGALRLIPSDDIEAHRNAEGGELRDGLRLLAYLPRYTPCSEKESKAMAGARDYLSARKSVPELEALYSSGLAYCDKPLSPRPRFLFL